MTVSRLIQSVAGFVSRKLKQMFVNLIATCIIFYCSNRSFIIKLLFIVCITASAILLHNRNILRLLSVECSLFLTDAIDYCISFLSSVTLSDCADVIVTSRDVVVVVVIADVRLRSMLVNSSQLEGILESNFSLSRHDVEVLYNSQVNFSEVRAMHQTQQYEVRG